MAKAPPSKNSIEYVTIEIPDKDGSNRVPEEYRDVKIGIKHVGAHQVREWGLEMRRLQLEEEKRQLLEMEPDGVIESLRDALEAIAEGNGGPGDLADLAKEALSSTERTQSLEFVEGWNALQTKVLSETVGGVEGLDDTPKDKAEPALWFIESMGSAYEAAVFRKAQEVQSLELRQSFRSSAAGG